MPFFVGLPECFQLKKKLFRKALLLSWPHTPAPFFLSGKKRYLETGPLIYFCFLWFLYQVLTLPALQDVCLPTTAFMRVWQLEGRRLARILRGQQLALRYERFHRVYSFTCVIDGQQILFIKGQCRSFESLLDYMYPPDQEIEADQWYRPLCATASKRGRSWVRFGMSPLSDLFIILCCISPLCEKCEILYVLLFPSPKEVLLNVKMGVPGERCYYPPEELVWDASRDSSPRSLRTCLAAHYGLSPDSLLLAKHQPDKHTWEEISNWVRWMSNFLIFLF